MGSRNEFDNRVLLEAVFQGPFFGGSGGEGCPAPSIFPASIKSIQGRLMDLGWSRTRRVAHSVPD